MNRAKSYSYLIEDGSEEKKAKIIKKCVIKWKAKFENYKNCLEVTQFEKEKKKEIHIDSIKENHKEFIKNNKSISKTQQRFRYERHNVFTKEISKIDLS